MLDENRYISETICSWDHLLERYESHKKFTGKEEQWIFRGQKECKWGLKTKLEREIEHFGIDKNKFPDENTSIYIKEAARVLNEGFDFIEKGKKRKRSVFDLERGLLREFKRKCHHYEMNVPEKDDIAEWLALMQHYGAPTRLLDWTYSFFVAVYFALENAEKECAVWALETKWIDDRIQKIFPIIAKMYLRKVDKIVKPGPFKKVFMRKHPKSLVYTLNPYRLNKRLVIQQGVFLCPGDVSKPFEDNLATVLPESNKHGKFFKFTIKLDLTKRNEMLQQLHRMNMNRASLFPNLDGLASSLRTLLVFPDLLKPERL